MSQDNFNANETNSSNEEDLALKQEYDDYRKSLIFIHECPACHYAQAMIFLGCGFFSAVRMQFLWGGLNYKQIFGYSVICLITGSLGIYKMSYAFHIFQAQGRMKNRNINENKNI
jgi:hypothetical protein